MDSTSIELPGSELESITLDEGVLRVRFSRAYIIKTMTGSPERTMWWQAGELVIERATVEGSLPGGPLVCAGGEVGENVYTYRDMIPVPFDSRGRTHCALAFRDSDEKLVATGVAIRLEMRDSPSYIKHISSE